MGSFSVPCLVNRKALQSRALSSYSCDCPSAARSCVMVATFSIHSFPVDGAPVATNALGRCRVCLVTDENSATGCKSIQLPRFEVDFISGHYELILSRDYTIKLLPSSARHSIVPLRTRWNQPNADYSIAMAMQMFCVLHQPTMELSIFRRKGHHDHAT
jgi:hypothetical protein